LHDVKKFASHIIHPKRRHDEPLEVMDDEIREEIKAQTRFSSFAPPRGGNSVKWFVDAKDYFYAASIAIEEARESIYILDWWLSPELYLRRPPSQAYKWRLDRLLKQKAEQGVKIKVIVYKEVTQALSLSSAHTKHVLEALHPNITVMRHPDHNPLGEGLPGAEITLYWAHHEKLLLIDNNIAFIGGLDLSFGRWDTRSHALADVYPDDVSKEIWPGQDYNNARIMDFEKVDHWEQNQLEKKVFARMPWHDIHQCVQGPVVADLNRHFVERWNFIFNEKYKENNDGGRFSLLNFMDTSISRQEFGRTRCQIVRSAAKWSHGIEKETSIQNAYCELIRKSNHFIYIENQFFITATGTEGTPAKNQIGAAIVERVTRAAHEGTRFRIIICLPCVPGFAGDLQADGSKGTRAIMGYQYKSISRGRHSIFEALQSLGIDPNQYISFYNLRSYDRINAGDQLAQMERDSGMGYTQAQMAFAQEMMGEQGVTMGRGFKNESKDRVESQQQFNRLERQENEDRFRLSNLDSRQPGYAQQSSAVPTYPNTGIRPQYERSSLNDAVENTYEISRQNYDADREARSIDFPDHRRIPGRESPYERDSQIRSGYDRDEDSYTEIPYQSSQQRVSHISGEINRQCQDEPRSYDQAPRTRIPYGEDEDSYLSRNRAEGYEAPQEYSRNPQETRQDELFRQGQQHDESDNTQRSYPQRQEVEGPSYGQQYNRPSYSPDESRYARPDERYTSDDPNFDSEDRIRRNEGPHNYQDRPKIPSSIPQSYQREERQPQVLSTKQQPEPWSEQQSRFQEQGFRSYDDPVGIRKQFQQAWRRDGENQVRGTIADDALLGGDIRSEAWEGDPNSETANFVTEELYIHSKLMIIDDRIVICGSANINDRSQVGNHDSEIAMIVEDQEYIESRMDGQNYQASRYAATLRRQIFREHLGLLPRPDLGEITENMQPLPIQNIYDLGSREDDIVVDPLSDDFLNFWTQTSRRNTEVFSEIFRCVPDARVESWDNYENFSPRKDIKTGHVVNLTVDVKDMLGGVRGHLVDMPLNFLAKVKLVKEDLVDIATEEIYL